MTSEEFAKWWKIAQAAYPGLLKWVDENSPDRDLTLHFWGRTLGKMTFADCLQVIDDWATGKAPEPKAYERDQFARLVLARAKQIRWNRKLAERKRLDDIEAAAFRKRKRVEWSRPGFFTGRAVNRITKDNRTDDERKNDMTRDLESIE